MNLPPLPEPDVQYVSGFDEPVSIYYKDDILDYGKAAYNKGVAACMERLYEMHRNTASRHNYYQHAAREMAKLKEQA